MGSTSATATLTSERWLDQIILSGTYTNENGDHDLTFLIPAGLGDIAILEIDVQALSVATMMANPELNAVRAYVVSAAGDAVDIVGTQRWSKVWTDRVATYLSPDPLVLVRQSERLKLSAAEVDTNASPTVDIVVTVKAVRVRPIEAPARGPIRLVR